jgi:hypothetical protein
VVCKSHVGIHSYSTHPCIQIRYCMLQMQLFKKKKTWKINQGSSLRFKSSVLSSLGLWSVVEQGIFGLFPSEHLAVTRSITASWSPFFTRLSMSERYQRENQKTVYAANLEICFYHASMPVSAIYKVYHWSANSTVDRWSSRTSNPRYYPKSCVHSITATAYTSDWYLVYLAY